MSLSQPDSYCTKPCPTVTLIELTGLGLIFALVAFESERWLRIAYVLNEQIVEKTKMEVERIHREQLRELTREADHEKKLAGT